MVDNCLNIPSIINGSIVLSSEPLHGLVFGDSVLGSDGAFASSSESDSASGSLEDDVEVHSEDTGEGVILDAEINMLLDSESETSGIAEVFLLQFSVLNLQASLQDLVGLISSHCHVHCDFFISFNAEASDCEASTGWDWLLAGEILQDF